MSLALLMSCCVPGPRTNHSGDSYSQSQPLPFQTHPASQSIWAAVTQAGWLINSINVLLRPEVWYQVPARASSQTSCILPRQKGQGS